MNKHFKKIMKINFISIICLFCIVVFLSCGNSSDSKDISIFLENQNSEKSILFLDEFDGNDIDYTKWEKCPEWERQSHMNNHGWWSKSCSYVKDGNLVLELKKRFRWEIDFWCGTYKK